MATVRRQKTIWSNESTGAAGASDPVSMGSATNAVLFVQVSAATDISIEVSPGTGGSGINDFDSGTAVWYPLWEDDLSAASKITFGAAGKGAFQLSQIASEYIRLVSTNNITASAFVNYIAAG
jgi:hypothetical protein